MGRPNPFTLAAVLLLLVVPLWAVDDPPRLALVIGNSSYDGDAALANPVNDATDVAAALGSLGWKVTTLFNGDRKSMNRLVFEFRDALAANPEATALLYYAGHGIQINGQNYLIPVRETFASEDEVSSDAVALQTVLNAFDEGKVAISIVILDACRDNPFIKKSTRSVGSSRGLSVVNKPLSVVGSAVMFSTAPGDTAADGSGRNGIFTQALLKYLTPEIKLQDLATKVTGEVRRLTVGKQVPFNSISLSDDFYMGTAALRSVVARGASTDPESSATGENLNQKVSLLSRRSAISQQRSSLVQNTSWTTWVGWGGLATLVAGGSLSGYGLWGYNQAKTSYEQATLTSDQAGWDNARAQKSTMNTLFSLGLGLLGTGSLGVLVPVIFGPDTSGMDRKLADIDAELVLLGGN